MNLHGFLSLGAVLVRKSDECFVVTYGFLSLGAVLFVNVYGFLSMGAVLCVNVHVLYRWEPYLRVTSHECFVAPYGFLSLAAVLSQGRRSQGVHLEGERGGKRRHTPAE